MICLQRSVTVRTFDVEGTVAIGRERPEFLAVARLAADLGRPIGGRDVTQELLGGLPEHVGWRVIDRCIALGLLARREDRGPAELSAAGAIALEHGAVLVPEEGVWRFYWAEDPLLDEPLLHAWRIESPWASDERKELAAARRQGGGRPGPGERTPPLFRPGREDARVVASVAAGHLFSIVTVAELGAAGLNGTLRLTLEWDLDRPPKVAVRGALEAPAIDGDEKPRDWRVDRALPVASALANVSYDAVWVALAAGGGRVDSREVAEWCARAGGRVLPVTFADGLADDARRAMRMSVTVPQVQLGGLGPFEGTRLEDVVLVPRTADDAQRWAEWMQWAQISDYATPEIVRAGAHAVLARFPHHRPRLPEPSALLDQARSAPRTAQARFLLAPADLGLWR